MSKQMPIRQKNKGFDLENLISCKSLEVIEVILDELSIKDRDLLSMVYGFGEYPEPLTYAEIAECMGYSRSTVKRNLDRIFILIQHKAERYLLQLLQK